MESRRERAVRYREMGGWLLVLTVVMGLAAVVAAVMTIFMVIVLVRLIVTGEWESYFLALFLLLYCLCAAGFPIAGVAMILRRKKDGIYFYIAGLFIRIALAIIPALLSSASIETSMLIANVADILLWFIYAGKSERVNIYFMDEAEEYVALLERYRWEEAGAWNAPWPR